MNRHNTMAQGPFRGKRRLWARTLRRVHRRAPHAPARDRGTVLLMVLGVLALMGIVAVVYAALGKADRTASMTLARESRIDDQVDQIAQYMADVIGRDVFATYAQEDLRTNDPRSTVRLEAFDAPETDVMMLSIRPGTDAQWETLQRVGYHAFNPEGTYSRAWRDMIGQSVVQRRDPRQPSDPYLAATEPIFLNRNNPEWRSAGFGTTSDRYTREGADYMNVRDWAHISNFAPSGNFVNLWALRNNFRAPPGLGPRGPQPGMSAFLSLINPDTGYSYPIDRRDAERFLQGTGGSVEPPDAPVNPGNARLGDLVGRPFINRPADWTRNQIGAFRSVHELVTGAGNDNSPYGYNDPEYMPYQWADADGDGFFDSRWFELVDVFDPVNPRPVIPNAGRARLFVAARCVDLTGLVNVNTACDFLYEPGRVFFEPRPNDPTVPNTSQSRRASSVLPAGLTPADVDLQRLLRLGDMGDLYRVGNEPVGYDDLPQPAMLDAAGDYRAYAPDAPGRMQLIGNAAYQAIWEARRSNTVPSGRFLSPHQNDPMNNNRPFSDVLAISVNRFDFYNSHGYSTTPGRSTESGELNRFAGVFDEADELELRTFQGLNDPSRLSRLEATVAGRARNEPEAYNLSPLRDNRPAVLEWAGRDLPPPRDMNNTEPPAGHEYRKALLAAQIDVRRLLTTISGARPIIDDVVVTAEKTVPTELSERAGTLKVDGARLVSRLVETGNYRESGSGGDYGRENIWDDVGWFDGGAGLNWFEAAFENRLPPVGVTPPQARPGDDDEHYEISRLDLMREAFRAYADCLLPYTDNRLFPDAWEREAGNGLLHPRVRHLHYGGDPELALRMAAHLALNLRDACDTDRLAAAGGLVIPDSSMPWADANMQTAVSLDLTRAAMDDVDPDHAFPWPKLNLDNRFDPSDDTAARQRMSSDPDWVVSAAPNPNRPGGGNNSNKKVNLFGIEPQPFLTQVTAMSMYWDTPSGSSQQTRLDFPDDEFQNANLDNTSGEFIFPPVTINVQRKIGPFDGLGDNPDYLCTVVAFQLTNPFDTDIVLEPSNPNDNPNFYYIEYARRYYRLCEDDKDAPGGLKQNNDPAKRILKAGETKTFYATFPSSLEEVSRRFHRAREIAADVYGGSVPAFDENYFEQFAKHEFGEDCVHVAAMYPESGWAVGSTASGAPDGLANVDPFAVSAGEVIGAEIGVGPNGEPAQAPAFGKTDAQHAETRRVVYLWRAVQDYDGPDGDQSRGENRELLPNWPGNDILLDRLRDPSDPNLNPSGMLIEAVIDPFVIGDQQTGGSNKEIPGTQAGPHEGPERRDNTGYSLISWVTITRPTNPPRNGMAEQPGRVPTGAMPPWCMEAKPDNVYKPGFDGNQRSWSLNRVRGHHGEGSSSDYTNPDKPYYETLEQLLAAHAESTSTRYVEPDLREKFAELRGRTADSGGGMSDPDVEYSIAVIDRERSNGEGGQSEFTGVPRRFGQVAIEVHRLPPDMTGANPPRENAPRALFSRVGDFLLPLAIGPWHDPYREPPSFTGNSDVDRRDAQWTTLSEVLALATDYYSGPRFLDNPSYYYGNSRGGSSGSEPNIFYKFAHDNRHTPGVSAAEYSVPKADRGHLVLDAWAPYLDHVTRAGLLQYDWASYDLSSRDLDDVPPFADAPLGNGIPLALNVLSKFRVAGLPGETQGKARTDPRLRQTPKGLGELFTKRVGRPSAYGSATRLVPGLININTAPVAVLRLLPLVSPARDAIDPNNAALNDTWLFDGRFNADERAKVRWFQPADPVTGYRAPHLAPFNPAQRLWEPFDLERRTWDVAATIDAYRWKIANITRRFSNDSDDAILINYRDDRELAQDRVPRSGRDDSLLINVEGGALAQGGLRDGRGFKSEGELMALQIKRSDDPNARRRARGEGFTPNDAFSYQPDVENSITRLAHDGASNASMAIDSSTYKANRAIEHSMNPSALLEDAADQIADDYDEKLSIANAVLNLITVRSDVFCVWFIIHGYTPEDVQVEDGFPMTPSLARRYVMVVDRSNVDSPTKKPRIVMLKEVPMP